MFFVNQLTACYYFCVLLECHYQTKIIILFTLLKKSKIRLKTAFAFFTGLLFLIYGCNPTKYVSKDKYLLNSVKINVHNSSIDAKELKSYVRQKENKKILGFSRFQLWLYNLSNINKKKGIHKYLQNVGEEPVIWDRDLTDRTVKQMRLYLTKKGYYNASVYDSIRFSKKKADVIYYINTNKPYVIRNISYVFEDTSIRHLVFNDTINSKIKRGAVYDEDVLQNERIRIEYLLRNNGYFNFNRDFIGYEPDSALNSSKVDIEMHFRNSGGRVVPSGLNFPQYQKYKINQVVISTENDNGMQQNSKFQSMVRDTISNNGIKFIYQENFWVRPNIILQSNYIFPGAEYKVSEEEETKAHLFSLNVFSIVKIQFTENPASDTSQFRYIDCQIRLSPINMQSYSFEVEGTNASGNFGGAVNLVYQHKSLFGNAENFSLKLRGAIESVKNLSSGNNSSDITQNLKHIQTVHEYGAEASISLPKFLLPINRSNFVKKYNPKTVLTVAYNFQQRIQYTRTVANATFGYNWKSGKFASQSFRPIELSFVKIPVIDSTFKASIQKTFLGHTFYTHLITSTGYSYTFNNQNFRKKQDFQYFRWNIESAGNLLNAYNKLAGTKDTYSSTDSSYYTLFGTRYSQYIKTDIDYHYFHYISDINSAVYRIYAGIGVPYGNAQAIPFEKEYFAGGANSMRGWQVYSLGPGSYRDTSAQSYPNKTGDLKLEANAEYRFKLFWVLEGALFADVGNIWSLSKNDDRNGGLFKWNKFYKDIAVAGGLGIRWDFGFFLFRTDLGMKMRDPSLPQDMRWFVNRGMASRDFALSFAISYPF
jgi:outer membrane protein assembly factor BamA